MGQICDSRKYAESLLQRPPLRKDIVIAVQKGGASYKVLLFLL
jgi:hypothetical protein